MHTNHTSYYDLPQYVDNDVINHLEDTNGAYDTIDSTLYELASTTGDNSTDITGIKNAIGNEHLDTVSQIITGALNELKNRLDGEATNVGNISDDVDNLKSQMITLNGDISSLDLSKASNTSVEDLNTLKADKTTVEELSQTKADKTYVESVDNYLKNNYVYVGTHVVNVVADGVKTNKEIFKDLADACVAYFATLDDDTIVRTLRSELGGSPITPRWFNIETNQSVVFYFLGLTTKIEGGHCFLRNSYVSSVIADNSFTEYYLTTNGNVATDLTNHTTVNGENFNVVFDVFKKRSNE